MTVPTRAIYNSAATDSHLLFGAFDTDRYTSPLTVHVYDTDRYGRSVGDLHAGGVFVQEQMLKKGFAWHYAAYDKHPELAKWQSQAQAARKGLWASKKPQEPWEYRKAKHNGNA